MRKSLRRFSNGSNSPHHTPSNGNGMPSTSSLGSEPVTRSEVDSILSAMQSMQETNLRAVSDLTSAVRTLVNRMDAEKGDGDDKSTGRPPLDKSISFDAPEKTGRRSPMRMIKERSARSPPAAKDSEPEKSDRSLPIRLTPASQDVEPEKIDRRSTLRLMKQLSGNAPASQDGEPEKIDRRSTLRLMKQLSGNAPASQDGEPEKIDRRSALRLMKQLSGNPPQDSEPVIDRRSAFALMKEGNSSKKVQKKMPNTSKKMPPAKKDAVKVSFGSNESVEQIEEDEESQGADLERVAIRLDGVEVYAVVSALTLATAVASFEMIDTSTWDIHWAQRNMMILIESRCPFILRIFVLGFTAYLLHQIHGDTQAIIKGAECIFLPPKVKRGGALTKSRTFGDVAMRGTSMR
eukprot:540714-Ditylum_brightwellii.AAC.1